MWQAHSRCVTTGWTGVKKPNFSNQIRSTPVVRLLTCFLLVFTGGSPASETQTNLSLAPDAIYNEIAIESRVLGGGDAEVGAWPSMVAIATNGNFPLEDRFFCGGTVISDRWILTAAHCMFGPFGTEIQPADIRVVVGIHDLQDESVTEAVVTNIIVHPQYDIAGGTLQNDIALLELANVVTAPSATLFDGDPEDFNDTLGFIAGWGAIALNQVNDSEVYPNLLQDASVPLASLENCNSDESYQGGIINTQVCAGFREGGIDSCVGDSGGPLFLMQGGEPVQVGITSFGNGCGLPNFYGVYTSVSMFRSWISGFVSLPDSSSSDTLAAIDEAGEGAGADVGAAIDGSVNVASISEGGSLNLSFLGLLLGWVVVRGAPAPLKTAAKLKRTLNSLRSGRK